MKKLIALIVVVVVLKWWFTDPTIEVATSTLGAEPVSMGYLVKYPAGAGGSDLLPLLIVLHGNGDTAENFYNTALDLLSTPTRVVLLKAPIPYGRGSSWPGDAKGFKHYGEAVKLAVEAIELKFPTSGKPILFGFSGGGMMAYYQALKYGDLYAAIVAVSGMMSTDLLSNEQFQTGAPVYAYHGKSDSVVSIGGGKTAVELLKQQNIAVEFIQFDGDHLGVFTNMKPQINKKIDQLIVVEE